MTITVTDLILGFTSDLQLRYRTHMHQDKNIIYTHAVVFPLYNIFMHDLPYSQEYLGVLISWSTDSTP